jgi:hypothetical protein
MNIFSFFIAATLLASLPTLAQTHCKADEVDYFSCQIVNSTRVASICGNVENRQIEGSSWVQYRFGSMNHLELVYPEQKGNSASAFEGNAFGRYQIVDLRFVSGDVLYSVTLDGTFYGDPSVEAQARMKPTGGVTVNFDSSKGTTFSCRRVNEKKYYSAFEELALTLREAHGNTDIAYEFYKRKRKK